jgi:hypothetical protein
MTGRHLGAPVSCPAATNGASSSVCEPKPSPRRAAAGTVEAELGGRAVGLLAAVVLSLGWEAGKWIARRISRAKRATVLPR